VITDDEIKSALSIIGQTIETLPTLKGAEEDSVIPPPEKKVKIVIQN
jgi:ornithine--oxo-acid transaminase